MLLSLGNSAPVYRACISILEELSDADQRAIIRDFGLSGRPREG